jgi:hypothetical protein
MPACRAAKRPAASAVRGDASGDMAVAPAAPAVTGVAALTPSVVTGAAAPVVFAVTGAAAPVAFVVKGAVGPVASAVKGAAALAPPVVQVWEAEEPARQSLGVVAAHGTVTYRRVLP